MVYIVLSLYLYRWPWNLFQKYLHKIITPPPIHHTIKWYISIGIACRLLSYYSLSKSVEALKLVLDNDCLNKAQLIFTVLKWILENKATVLCNLMKGKAAFVYLGRTPQCLNLRYSKVLSKSSILKCFRSLTE